MFGTDVYRSPRPPCATNELPAEPDEWSGTCFAKFGRTVESLPRNSLAETTSGVGVPSAERALTEAAVRCAHDLLGPGPGRSLFVLPEVDLGVGRPDLLLFSASRRALEARARSGLRLANLTEARVLAALNNGGGSGHSASHARAVASRLQDGGWLRSGGSVRTLSPTIGDSMLVEAKVSDWRTGLQQLTRTRWASHSAALLVPSANQRRVPRKTLRHNRLGLLVLNGEGLRWQLKPPRRPLSWLADVWLAELAIRNLEQRP